LNHIAQDFAAVFAAVFKSEEDLSEFLISGWQSLRIELGEVVEALVVLKRRKMFLGIYKCGDFISLLSMNISTIFQEMKQKYHLSRNETKVPFIKKWNKSTIYMHLSRNEKFYSQLRC
jgi:hypothetical protein